MGAQLVGLAFAAMEGRKIPMPARLVLLRMAHTARDTDDPPVYYAGRDKLALSIGYREADLGTENVTRHVRRLVTALISEGLIERVDGDGRPVKTVDEDGKQVPGFARTHRSQRYALRLGSALLAPEADLSDPPEADTSDPPGWAAGGSEVSGLGGLADPPKEEGGTSNYQEPPQDNSISPKVTSPARTGEDDDDEYPRARDLLLALPEAQQDRARAWALAEFPDATATRRAIEAARMLGVLA